MKASEFVEVALSDRTRAEQIVTEQPRLAGSDFHAALVAGEAAAVTRMLEKAPGAAGAQGGPRKWEPLLYVCFSQFANRASERAPGIVETANVLLRAGANPDASYVPEKWPDNPLSCLYAACGLHNNPELAAALLEAGADPNDNESLYHSTEHADLECMKLLLAHGALPAGTNALKHMLDREDVEGLRLLLAAGADPNEVNPHDDSALHWAVWRGRSTEVVAALLEHGAAIDAKRHDDRTAYAMAVVSGQDDVAALLEQCGADTTLSEVDRFIRDCASASPAKLKALLAKKPEIPASSETDRLMPDLAAAHRTAAVRGLLAAGLPVDARGAMGATALHWACWKGYPDLVELLLAHGASLTIEDRQYFAPPAGWFGHGVRNCDEPGGEYAAVARLLLAAGAKISPADIPTGNASVDAVLREHGLITPG